MFCRRRIKRKMEENVWSIKVKENGERKKEDSLPFIEKKDHHRWKRTNDIGEQMYNDIVGNVQLFFANVSMRWAAIILAAICK